MAQARVKKTRIGILNATVLFFSALLISFTGLLYLNTQGIINIPEGVARVLRDILVIIAAFFIVSLFIRLTIKAFYRLFSEPEESIFYSKIYSWSLYSLGIVVLLYYFGVSLGNITLFLGLIATGLAFAIRDVLLSFFVWMILLRKNPFRIGDYIRIGEDEGKVIHIGTFYVLLDNTPFNTQDFIRVPNKLFLEKSIFNLGKSLYHDKIRFQLVKMPDNPPRVLAEIQKQVRLATGNNEFARVYIDVQNEKLLLEVEYLIPFENRKEKRTDVIMKIYGMIGEAISMPRI